MEIRLIKEDEIQDVYNLIKKTVQISFKTYYPQSSIDYVIESLSPETLKRRSGWTHFYIIKDCDQIVACGAIGPYWDSQTESGLFNIFVDPDHQGKGYGRKLMQTLEADEYALRADRIEIPASLVAIPFYRKMGYKHKNDELIFEDGHIKLEKYTKK